MEAAGFIGISWQVKIALVLVEQLALAARRETGA